MKRTIAVVLVLAGLIGGAMWYGMNRSQAVAGDSPESSQKLLLAEKYVDQNNPGKALEVLEELENSGVNLGERGKAVRISAVEADGDREKAAKLAKEFLAANPESDFRKEVEVVRLTSALASSGLTNPELRESVENFLQENPEHPAAGKLHVALARQDLELGDYSAARRRLGKAMDGAENMDAVIELAGVLGEANLKRLKSPALSEGDFTYTVERGDTINGIARDHGITEELLMECNNIDNPRLLRVGQKLKVPNVDFSLVVDIASNTMQLKNHGEFFKLYEVRTGREAGATPTGEFKILNKKTNPTWRPGNGYVYPPGDPNNELGTRWMAFEGDILGIHGTVHPKTVGEYASNGCVGLRMDEVEQLFNLITVGTPLKIKGEQDFERNKVLPAPDVPPPMEVAKND